MADKGEDDTVDKKHCVDLSRVKNKVKRSILYKQEKHNKNKEKRDRKKKRKREEDELGDEVSVECVCHCAVCPRGCHCLLSVCVAKQRLAVGMVVRMSEYKQTDPTKIKSMKF